jgi:hypothetical protein
VRVLVSSALLVRTVSRMMDTPTGVDADRVMTTTVNLSSTTYPTWRVVAQTHASILDSIRQQPGVQAAGGGNFLPLEVGWRNPFVIEGEPPPARAEDAPQAQMHSVSDGYFEALGAKLAPAARSRPSTRTVGAVLVVNEAIAARYLSKSAVGRLS